MHGLRIRQRMREQYGTATASELPSSRKDDDEGRGDQNEGGSGGGFLTAVGDVVQPYSLPRPTHVVFASPPRSPEPDDRTPELALTPPLLDDDADEGKDPEPRDSDLDVRTDELPADKLAGQGMPKSMAQLAAEAEAAATAQMRNAVQQGDAEVREAQEGAASEAPPRRRMPPRARPKANGAARAERPRGRKRVRVRESEDDDEWVGGAQPGDGGIEEDAIGEDGRPRDAKRPRRDRRTALATPVATSDRVLRARKSVK